jgi:hypothetical protein
MTTPKLSKAQRELLEAMQRGETVSRSLFRVRANAIVGPVNAATIPAMVRLGLVAWSDGGLTLTKAGEKA